MSDEYKVELTLPNGTEILIVFESRSDAARGLASLARLVKINKPDDLNRLLCDAIASTVSR